MQVAGAKQECYGSASHVKWHKHYAYMHVQLACMANYVATSMYVFTFTRQPMFLLQVQGVPAILHLHPLCLVWLLPALCIRQTCALLGAAFAMHCTSIWSGLGILVSPA